jgi:hypothetical protein
MEIESFGTPELHHFDIIGDKEEAQNHEITCET